MKTLLLFFVLIITSFPTTLFGFDFIIEKAPLSGPDINLNYSIIRNNSNDGYILCGTSYSLQGIGPTIISIKDNGVINWSKSLILTPNRQGNVHAICPNFDSTGYILVGQFYEYGKFNSHGFVIEISELGSNIRSFSSAIPGGFLNIKNTLDSGYLIAGYISSDTALYTTQREAFFCKLDSDLTLLWGKTFLSAEYEKSNYYNRYENAEVIVNFISPVSERQMHFIAGTYTATGLLGKQVPAMVFFVLDEYGNLVNFETTEKYFTPVDAIFDYETKKMILLSNKTFDLGAGSSFGIISIIDPFEIGNSFIKSYKVYASSTDFDHYIPQLLSFHKISSYKGQFKAFGYIRKMAIYDYYTFKHKQMQNPNIPFHVDFNFSNMSNSKSYCFVSYTPTNQDGYSKDNHGYWGTSFSEPDGFPSGLAPAVVTPDMGCTYIDKNNFHRFGMIGYTKKNSSVSFYSLNLYSDFNDDFCNRHEMFLQFKSENLGRGMFVKLADFMVFPKNILLLNTLNIDYYDTENPLSGTNLCNPGP